MEMYIDIIFFINKNKARINIIENKTTEIFLIKKENHQNKFKYYFTYGVFTFYVTNTYRKRFD